MFAKAAVATGAGVAESPPKSAANIRRLSRTIGLSITILLSAFAVKDDLGVWDHNSKRKTRKRKWKLAGVAVGGGQYRNAVASGRRPCHNQERSYTLIDRRYRCGTDRIQEWHLI